MSLWRSESSGFLVVADEVLLVSIVSFKLLAFLASNPISTFQVLTLSTPSLQAHLCILFFLMSGRSQFELSMVTTWILRELKKKFLTWGKWEWYYNIKKKNRSTEKTGHCRGSNLVRIDYGEILQHNTAWVKSPRVQESKSALPPWQKKGSQT